MGVPIVGNLTKDVNFHPKNGEKKSFATFRIAINTGKDQKPVFLPVKCWGFAADDSKSLTKGDKVVIDGRLCMEEWTDADGNERSEVGIIADIVAKVQRELSSSETDF